MSFIELMVGMTLLVLILLGLVPVFVAVMKGTVQARWDTLATQGAEDLIEIIKRVASTPTGYNTGDTDNSGVIQTTNYQELPLSSGNYDDPFNPIPLGVSGLRANRKYSVVTTNVGTTSYKTITVWVESINSPLLRTIRVEIIISSP